MSAPIIILYTLNAHNYQGQQQMIRHDHWIDFADWLKQHNLAGRDITIHHWEYDQKLAEEMEE